MFHRSSFVMKPSEINYTCSAMGVSTDDIDGKVSKMMKTFSQKKRVPRLQVVSQDGQYFTLNNTVLHLCRTLEERGDIQTVRVEVVPKSKVPEGISRLLETEAGPRNESDIKKQENDPSVNCTMLAAEMKSNERGLEDKKDTDSVLSINLESDVESVDSVPDPYLYTSAESSTDASTDSDLGENLETVV